MPGQTTNILIVEDVRSLAETYVAYLADGACQVAIASTGEEAAAALAKQPPSVLVLDVNLPDIDGLDILRRVKADWLPTEVIVITSKASVNLAVEAMKEGAFDFIMKPLSADRLRVTVRNALERHQMSGEIAEFKEEFCRDRFVDFIGHSLAMQAVYRIIQSAAPSNATVFITGESGTGKELCASAIHKLSPRRNGPFVVINCAAIPKDLLESKISGM
jgi:two-component system, repressor protein LuxO